MVLENVRASFTYDDSCGTSRLELLVLSCCFKLGSRDWDRSLGVHFLGDGASDHCHKHPTYKLPITDSISFFDTKSKNGY
jgi:hypothetical protein